MMSAITQNSTLSQANGHTNSESFLLFGNNLHVAITSLQGNMTFVIGVNNNLFLNADSVISQGLLSPPKPETISDLAQGTHIRINPAAQEMVPVIVNGFQFDHTATLSVDNGGKPIITSDGHGGRDSPPCAQPGRSSFSEAMVGNNYGRKHSQSTLLFE